MRARTSLFLHVNSTSTSSSSSTTTIIGGAAGFTVRLRVLVGGQVRASATLVRSSALRTVPSVQTVRRDGFASALFIPSQARPGAPAVVVIGGSGYGPIGSPEGGTRQGNALADEQSWPRMIAFFNDPWHR